MRKCKIVAWDYDYKITKEYPKKEPKGYEVEAWCVQGEEGFRALFILGDEIVEASGDDGHWWITGSFHTDWLSEFSDMVQAMMAEVIIKGKKV